MAKTIDMSEKCRQKLIAVVAAAGVYLQKNAERLIDQADLHSDVDIHISIPNDRMIPTIEISQYHLMPGVIEALWNGVKEDGEAGAEIQD